MSSMRADLAKLSAKHEAKDIETKIDIVRKAIEKYSIFLNMNNYHMEETYIEIKTKLEREEKKLLELKDRYPEHFI